MRVLFDATCLIPEKLSGIGVYAKNLFLSLQAVHPDLVPVYKKSRLLKTKHISRHIGRKGSAFFETQLALSSSLTLLHGPDFRLLSSHPKIKKVVTVHDVAVFHENFNSQKFRESGQLQMNVLFEDLQPDRVIVPTETVKSEILARWQGWDDRVVAIPHGGDHLLAKAEKQEGAKPLAHSFPYFLYVGHLENRKNLDGILSAFEKYCEQDTEIRLVLVGKDGFNAESFHQRIQNSKFKDRIVLKGFVTDQALATLYQQARAFLFPSFYEGFGFPILEAMALGCPVLTSNFGSMKEVAGEAALLVDPHSLESLVAGLKLLHESESQRTRLIEAGHSRVKEFTWQKTAKRVAQVYKELEQS